MLKKVSIFSLIAGIIAIFSAPILPDILVIIGSIAFVVGLLILLDQANKNECAYCNNCPSCNNDQSKIDVVSARNNLSNS